MRKEIFAIILFSLVILILTSLLSYSSSDPSIHHSTSADHIYNLFGLPGAYISGILIGLFGVGAFWIPILLLFLSIHIFCGHQRLRITKTISGGILLIVTTGSLFTFLQTYCFVFENKISSGGIIGIQLKSSLLIYSGFIGSLIILTIMWIIGFMLISGFPLMKIASRSRQVILHTLYRTKVRFVIWREQKKRAKKRPNLKEKTEHLK